MRETNPASNQFHKCSPQPRTHKESQELVREEKAEGGDRGDVVEKKASQKWGRSFRRVITLLS